MTLVEELVLSPRGFTLEHREERQPVASEIRVRVAYVGICGSELHIVHDKREETEFEPLVLGHEYSGVIEAVGPDVASLAVGDRVACKPRIPCLLCRYCHAGRIWDCERLSRAKRGAWAETIIVDERFAVLLPEDVSLRQAALTEPLSCCLRAVDRAGFPAGHTALVIGGGPIGLLTALLERHTGATEVAVVEAGAYRRKLAASLGFTVLDAADDVATVAAAITDGRGFDVVHEAVGAATTVELAVACAGRGSRVVVIGLAPRDVVASIRPFEIFWKELEIVGAWANETTFTRAIALLGPTDAERIVTHEFPLEDGAEAVALADSGQCGKVLIRPNAGLS